MMTDEAPMKRKISLHGLGFVQVQLTEDWRLNVWHPDLPRRKCLEHSKIHNHSFSFQSMVLAGELREEVYRFGNCDASHPKAMRAYRHDGPRTKFGNRPWLMEQGYYAPVLTTNIHEVKAGQLYHAHGPDFHMTEALGDGRLATLMAKTERHHTPAHTMVEAGVEPDADFDRFQWPEEALWTAVVDVLRHGKGNLMPSVEYLTGGRFR